MTRKRRMLVAALLAVGIAGIGSAHPTFAAGGGVADCSFATLQADLQSGGDWYYAPGQCPTPITFTSTITISSNASLTAQGNDIAVDGGGGTQLFSVNASVSLGLSHLTLQHGYSAIYGGAIYNGGTLTITSSTLSGNSVTLT